jgi:guanine deaminase
LTNAADTAAYELIRAAIFHTPRDAFRETGALESYADGGLLIRGGRIAACGEYSTLHGAYPDAKITDWCDSVVIPGLVDTHVHFPQVRVIGSLGQPLLEWLEHSALKEESRMANLPYARETASLFVHALASSGTTSAVVFGSHFVPATAALFEAAQESGLRVASGLVVSDRLLRPELHQTADTAYRDSKTLIDQFHGKGHLLYSVTPRFALSASESMLEVCQALMNEHPDVRFQTHINESPAEIEKVRSLFPWADDYLSVYSRFGLVGTRSILAHNVHPTETELGHLATSGAAIAHCPSSNAALGSGIFPMCRHLAENVQLSLGTDIGAGTSFSILNEALQAYLMQRAVPGGAPLTPPQMLYLATRAGAEAMNLETETGDFEVGKAADLVCIRPRPKTPLRAILDSDGDPDRKLAAVIALGRDSIAEVRVEGSTIYNRDDD